MLTSGLSANSKRVLYSAIVAELFPATKMAGQKCERFPPINFYLPS